MAGLGIGQFAALVCLCLSAAPFVSTTAVEQRLRLMLEEAPLAVLVLDRHGTGRVRFRNTRVTVTGFPRRVARLAPLDADSSKLPLLDWLAELLRTLSGEKVLLICHTQAKVAAIEAALRHHFRREA